MRVGSPWRRIGGTSMARLKDHQDDPDVEGHQHTILEELDTSKIGIAILIIAIALLSVFSIYLLTQLDETVERLDGVVSARLEEAQKADEEQVTRCFSSATQGPVLRRVLLSFERETMDPTTKQDLQEFRRLSLLNTPTLRDCRLLAKQLGVDVPKGVGG